MLYRFRYVQVVLSLFRGRLYVRVCWQDRLRNVVNLRFMSIVFGEFYFLKYLCTYWHSRVRFAGNIPGNAHLSSVLASGAGGTLRAFIRMRGRLAWRQVSASC